MTRISHRAALVVVLTLVIASMLTATPAGATAQHAAGLVVDTGDRVVTVYVEFSEDTITGEELLRRADVDAVFAEYGSQGTAVCSILGVGSPKEDCFREAEQRGTYWNYSRAEDGDWQRSGRGVSSTTVEHGDVDGWAWGSSGTEPPYHSFEEIRRQHAPEPSPTPSSTAPPPSDPAPGEGEAPPSSPKPSPTATAPTIVADRATPPQEATGEPAGQPVTEAAPDIDPSATSPADPDDRAVDEPSPTPTTDAILATDETADRSRSAIALSLFVLVMIGLVGAIVWRRRTGTSGAGRGR
ncbi:MAG: hypothetical protein KY437_00900 [Actinobacteria bacterium]|nr:hypothetical protein [Actinomycetota bacterium]